MRIKKQKIFHERGLFRMVAARFTYGTRALVHAGKRLRLAASRDHPHQLCSIDISSLHLEKEALVIISRLQSFSLGKISRMAKVAHKIAKFSFNSWSDGLLVNSVPPGVAHAVITDCNNLLFN